MTSGRPDRPTRSFPAITKSEHEAPSGEWDGDVFRFKSPQHEQDWPRQAYRQSVRPEGWHTQPPVDHRTQIVLDTMPETGAGQYFRGPDGKYRHRTMELREDPEVQQIRHHAFSDFANTGVTWEQLGAYEPDKPHPGEDEALALSQAKAGMKAPSSASTGPNKMRDMGALPKNHDAITQVAGDLGLGLAKFADAWSGIPKVTVPPVIQVAAMDWSGASAAVKGRDAEPSFGAPKRPMQTTKVRRDFVESLVGRVANDNGKPAAKSNVATAPAEGKAAGQMPPLGRIKPATGAGMSAEDIADAEYMNGLFNWQREGNQAPAPKAYAIHAASDEGRFAYLEGMKDEWSGLVEAHPKEIFQSMIGEVEKLSHAAQQHFFTAHHRVPNGQELAEINDAVEKVVFAPAEHWTDSENGPNQRARVHENKPYLGAISSERVSGQDAVNLLSQASRAIAEIEPEKLGGRLGSKETRDMAALMTQKLADAIKACGGEIVDTYNGRKEPLIRQNADRIKGGHYPDAGVTYKYNGKQIGIFGNHAGTLADGYTLQATEAKQIMGLARNLARAVGAGELGMEVAGFGYFSKRKPNQSMDDYLKAMDKFISEMIDCGRPFLIRVNALQSKEPLHEALNDNLSSQ